MNRLFNEHELRKTHDLNGTWKFKVDRDNVGEAQGWQNGLVDAETVTVPSCWNNELRLLNYEGCAWYEKKFNSLGGTLRFEFGSVMTKADIWLDGKHIGEHYGAFTQFEIIVNGVTACEHTLVVRADSTLDEQSFPQRYVDWFNYGGIARDVSFDELSGISILYNHIIYELSEDFKSAKVSAKLELYNANKTDCTSTVSVFIENDTIFNKEITLAGYETKTVVTPSVTLNDVELWDTNSPKLYTVIAKTETDDLIDKIGFRKVEVKDKNILLNGKPIELLGVNRHEEHPDWGFAFPAKLMKKDIDLILDMNCNTIRGSHYPQTQIFIDMLDEKGILFWSEIPMWGCGFSEKSLYDEVVADRGLTMHKEMTKYYYNHPSIIIWGMHNEVWTYDRTYEVTKIYNAHLREHGGNRLITHATLNPLGDPSIEFDDIVCVNMYHGWYKYGGYDKTMLAWNKFVDEIRERLISKNWDDKPVVMSEFGAAALAGFHSHFDEVRWSEEYQRDVLEYCLELFHNTDYIKGSYIWQFCNMRTSPETDINRVRYFNNKGILDEYRNPKAAYFKVKELYGKYAEENK